VFHVLPRALVKSSLQFPLTAFVLSVLDFRGTYYSLFVTKSCEQLRFINLIFMN